MIPKAILFGNGEFSFADAHDEAYYRATRFESLYTFQVVFSLFCLAQELGVIAHHVVAHPADRSLILLLLPLLALSSATLAPAAMARSISAPAAAMARSKRVSPPPASAFMEADVSTTINRLGAGSKADRPSAISASSANISA